MKSQVRIWYLFLYEKEKEIPKEKFDRSRNDFDSKGWKNEEAVAT